MFAQKRSTKYSYATPLGEYNSHALQVPVHSMTGVEIVETLGYVQELGGSQFSQLYDPVLHLQG